LIHRHAARFIRHLLQQFRAGAISAAAAAAELEISLRRFYGLWHSYLQAVARRRAHRWQPGVSGGNRRRCWPEPVTALMRKLLGSRPPCPYSFIASEVHRRCDLKLHRASVRRWALAQGLAPAGPTAKPARPVRRWQVQHVGQLWQYDASPHRWFVGQDWQPPLLEILDDHSRVITGARLYPRETLLAHLDFLSDVFRAVGLPLCLYVDYHSFFFTHTPDALTQLGAALRFYGVSLRYAPTPQAKGKVERVHLFWQNRLPPLFVAEGVTNIPSANPWIEQLRQHHNRAEHHRELGTTPQRVWQQAKREGRCALQPKPACPWWPYVFSQRTGVRVDREGRVSVGSQRLRIEQPPGCRVIRCHHYNGDISILQDPPDPARKPVLLLHYPAPQSQ
jgi:hypothetical protein